MLKIRPLLPGDWRAVRAIYEEGIGTRNATFETEAPSWEEWDAEHLPKHRLVAQDGAEVVGWVALAPVSRRPCYAGVADVSVYVAERAREQGTGRALLQAVIESSEAGGIWTLQAGIFPENAVSLALHERCGFRRVGVRVRIGRHHGVWRDVVLLERRTVRW